MSVELKPCPFCGGSNIQYIEERSGYGVVGCGDCCFTLPSDEWQLLPKDEAIRVWNTRTERTCGETCRNVDEGREFTCSECGARYHVLSQGEPTEQWEHVRRPGHCPNCGAKVVG